MNTKPFKDFADIFSNWNIPVKTIDWNELYRKIFIQRLKRRRPQYITYDIETGGLDGELQVFQSIGRIPRDGKSMHNYGLSIDMAVGSKESWAKSVDKIFEKPIRHIDLSCSDKIMSHMMMLKATQLAMNSTYGIPKERLGGEFRGINKIEFPELLNELLNYKHKKMKRFKNNQLAVKGEIIELLKFEKALKELGYENTSDRGDVFHYRGDKKITPWSEYTRDENAIADHITIGLHYCAKDAGQYTPARNDGNAKDFNCLFQLPQDFDKALKIASELRPLFVTEDKVEIFDTNTKVFGLKKVSFEGEGNHYPRERVYRNHVIVDTLFSIQVSPSYKWFSSLDAAKKYVDKTVPVLVTEDGVTKYKGDTVFYVRPDWNYHFWRSGISDNVDNNIKRGYKFFENESTLVEYIKRNKPYFHLSQNEMQEFLNDFLKPLGLSTTVEALEFPKDFVKRD